MSEQASQVQATTQATKIRATALHPIEKAVKDQPLFSIGQLTVAGDPETINGKIFANTGADDLRQGIPWQERHEAICAGFLAKGNTRLVAHPDQKSVKVRTQTGDPISLYLQVLPGGAGEAPREDFVIDGTKYAAVIEGGRQRRRCAEAVIARVKWIADTFGAPLRTAKAHGRMVRFRNAILEWLGSDAGKHSEEAAWLTESVVADLIGSPDEEYSGWFTPDLQPIGFLLTASTFGVNVDLSNPEVLARSIGRNEGKVWTPPSMRAAQIARLRAKVGPNGQPVLTFDRIGELLLGNKGGGDTIRDYSLVSDLIPEVLALMDSGMLSLKVAIKGNAGRRDQAFVNHPKGGERVVLTPAQQGYVLRCLVEEFTDENGKLRDISGDRAFKIALKAKEQALAGAKLTLKQLAELEGDEPTKGKGAEPETKAAQSPTQETPKTTAQKGPGAAQETPKTAPATNPQPPAPAATKSPAQAAQEAPAPSRPASGQPVNLPVPGALKPPAPTRWTEAQIAAWADRLDEEVATLPDPSVNGLTQSEIDRRQQAQAEAVIGAAVLAHLAGRAGALRDFPVLRKILVVPVEAEVDAEAEVEAAAPSPAAVVAPAETPARRMSDEEFCRTLAVSSIDAWIEANHPTEIPQVTATEIAGLMPTPEDIVKAQALLDRLAAEHNASDKSTELESFMLDRIYSN